ncbi:MAG: EFR1 family ferrodoxin [Raoultibacter sp.]|jgi:ferredoxin
MLFYFTGTGNSLDAAQIIAQSTGDTLIDIGQGIKHGRLDYVVDHNETLGFVCPTHAWTTPPIMDRFLEMAHFRDSQGAQIQPNYSYLVLTCSAFVGNTARFFAQKLQTHQGVKLDASFSITHVGSCITLYSPAEGEKQRKLLEDARSQTCKVAQKIAQRERSFEESRNPFGILMSQFSCKDSKHRSTSDFYTLGTCTQCGQCAEICPTNTISVDDAGPHWSADGCTQCYACIHRCPPHAIQCGKKTEGRARYVNPVLLGQE